MSSAGTMLKVDDLTVSYGHVEARVPALTGVSFEVAAGEACAHAEVLPAAAAVLALAAGPAQPRNAHPLATADDGADDLVTRGDGIAARGQLAIDQVQVGAAHAAGAHFDEHLAGLRFRRLLCFPREPGPRSVKAHLHHYFGRSSSARMSCAGRSRSSNCPPSSARQNAQPIRNTRATERGTRR